MRLRGGSPKGSERQPGNRRQSRLLLLTRPSSTFGSPHAVVRLVGP